MCSLRVAASFSGTHVRATDRRKGSPFPVQGAAHYAAVPGGEVKREAGISPSDLKCAGQDSNLRPAA
jgi:hypothetical protein